MGKVILRDGSSTELTPEQDMQLAKMIMLLPAHQLMKVNGLTFSQNDIDLEAERKDKLPKQMGLAIEVATVEVKRKRTME
jgi:hypothetical protein